MNYPWDSAPQKLTVTSLYKGLTERKVYDSLRLKKGTLITRCDLLDARRTEAWVNKFFAAFCEYGS